jgi:hypothetical protein
VRPGRETSTNYFHAGVGECSLQKKRVGSLYTELVFLHLVGTAGYIVDSAVSGAQNVDALFFMLGCNWYGFLKKCVETHYTDLVFLHPVRFAGHVVHFGVFGV